MGKTQGGSGRQAGRRGRAGGEKGKARDETIATLTATRYYDGCWIWRPSARDRVQKDDDEEKRARKWSL
jgi:hypothetical protein